MNGINTRLFEVVSERTKIHEAIEEFIDNSIDAKAKNIVINLDNKSSIYEHTDDGNGMNKEQIGNFVENYRAHMPMSNTNTIGSFGAGQKDSYIAMADFVNGADIAMTSWPNENEVSRVRFKIDVRREKQFGEPEITTNKDEKWVKENGKHGHKIVIKGIKDVTINDKQWKSNLFKELSRTYPYFISKGLKITVNGETVVADDKMHLSELGENLKESGAYFTKKGYVFIVRNYTLYNRLNNSDKCKATVVYLYVPEWAEKNDIGGFNGLYSSFEGRYLNTPKAGKTNLFFNLDSRGGDNRMRACIIITNENKDVFGLKSKKSDGIDVSASNITLNRYNVVNEDETFLKVFERDFKYLKSVHRYQSVWKNSIPKKELFRDEILSAFFSRKSIGVLNKMNYGVPSDIEAPIELTEAEKDEITSSVTEELETMFDEPQDDKKPIIDIKKNKTTGSTKITFTEYAPKGVNKKSMRILSDILLKLGIPQSKVRTAVTEYAYAVKAF